MKISQKNNYVELLNLACLIIYAISLVGFDNLIYMSVCTPTNRPIY